MRKTIRKIAKKVRSFLPIVNYLSMVLFTLFVYNYSSIQNATEYLSYEAIHASYFASIYFIVTTYLNKLCLYNWISSIGSLATNIFNTVIIFLGPSQIDVEFYYLCYTVSIMIPTAMMAIFAFVFNTPIEKLIVKYMDSKNKDT